MQKLSLSCRIAEGFLNKEEARLSLLELADLAIAAGYDSICMRASQVGVHSLPDQIRSAADLLKQRGLRVSMITGDFDIVYNNQRGPSCLRNIGPYLDLAEALGAPLVRVCVKSDDDVVPARLAAAEAGRRGLKLVHQCHVQSLFETVDQAIDTLQKIDHPNFGLIYEAANLEECRQDYGPVTIRRLAPWISNVYLQNQRLNAKGAVTLDTWCHGPIRFDILPLPESGGINFAQIFEGLRQIGYVGPVTVHQSAPEDERSTPLQAAIHSADFLRQTIDLAKARLSCFAMPRSTSDPAPLV